jgi:hypothetical protein
LETDPEAADLSAALWLSLFAYLCTGLFLHLSYPQYFWFLVALASVTLHVLHSKQMPVEANVVAVPAYGRNTLRPVVPMRWSRSTRQGDL